MVIVQGLGDRYNEIKWQKKHPKPTQGRRVSSARCPFSIIPDDFPAHAQGRFDYQSGIRLTSRSEFRRKLKEKGLVQL